MKTSTVHQGKDLRLGLSNNCERPKLNQRFCLFTLWVRQLVDSFRLTLYYSDYSVQRHP